MRLPCTATLKALPRTVALQIISINVLELIQARVYRILKKDTVCWRITDFNPRGQFFHSYCVPFGRTLIRLCLVQLVMHFMCLCRFFLNIYILKYRYNGEQALTEWTILKQHIGNDVYNVGFSVLSDEQCLFPFYFIQIHQYFGIITLPHRFSIIINSWLCSKVKLSNQMAAFSLFTCCFFYAQLVPSEHKKNLLSVKCRHWNLFTPCSCDIQSSIILFLYIFVFWKALSV